MAVGLHKEVITSWQSELTETSGTEKPRVWVNGTEVAAASITGTVKAATAMGVYLVVQNLAGGAIQRFITVDYVKVWQDRG